MTTTTPETSEKKPGFFARLFGKLDAKLKAKAEETQTSCCCSGKADSASDSDCACGPDCKCGPDCECGPDCKCGPGCTCGDPEPESCCQRTEKGRSSKSCCC